MAEGIASTPEAGLKQICSLARELQIYGHCVHYYPFVLGAQPVRPIDLARFYATVANEGLLPNTHVIEEISDQNQQLFAYAPPQVKRIKAADAAAFYQLKSMLQGVVLRGTAARLSAWAPYIAGKTGTTNEETDAWFVGFSNEVTVAVWVGYDNIEKEGDAGTRPHRRERRGADLCADHGSGVAGLRAEDSARAAARCRRAIDRRCGHRKQIQQVQQKGLQHRGISAERCKGEGQRQALRPYLPAACAIESAAEVPRQFPGWLRFGSLGLVRWPERIEQPKPLRARHVWTRPKHVRPGRRLLVALMTSVGTIRLCDANAQAFYPAQNVAGIRNLSGQLCIVRPVAMDFSMSEAVSTYRQHAEWAQRIAEATPDQKDADLILARARRLSEIADRFERQENPPINPAPSSRKVAKNVRSR